MISALEYKNLKNDFIERLKELFENSFYTDFYFCAKKPIDCIQYWKVDLTYFPNEKSLDVIENSIGYFTTSDLKGIKELSINDFFINDDKIIDEFFQIHTLCGFKNLLTPFIIAKEKDDSGVSLNIFSCNNFESEHMKNLCEEYLLIIHLSDEDKNLIDIGCQCNERYKIKIIENNRNNFLNIPFDKVCYFPSAERVDNYSNARYYEYEVAFSFAGEDRVFVEKIAKLLKNRGIRIFYDFYEKSNLWGKDLYEHLDNVYRKKSKFCVLFLSVNYKQKVWTNHERKSAQARAFEEHNEYILPIRLDNTEIEGIRPTLGYIDGTNESPKGIANLIQNKLNEGSI